MSTVPWMETGGLWTPAMIQPPPSLGPGSLTIPNDLPPWMPPPEGLDPSWWPLNYIQQAALRSPAQLLLYGGQAGGGKTGFLVGDAMQERSLPSFRGLLLRESLGEFDQIGDLMEAAYHTFLPPNERARYRTRSGGGQWIFPILNKRGEVLSRDGARIRYGYLASDRDLGKYRGNPYSWLGIDESGLHPMHRVRRMIPWLRVTDKRLRARARFASNPGEVGHGWQMSVFLRNRCPLHYPALGPKDTDDRHSTWTGQVYSGASWTWPPTRSELVHKTTAFFPASVADNPLYGQDAIDSLLSQTPEIQMQLLHGCWCNAQSLYFGFLRPEYMVPYPAIQDQWWWNHFISIDYGYGNSAAAAGMFAVDEYGRIFGTRELCEKKMISKKFAEEICELWIAPKMGEERPRILFATIDPSNDNEDGTGETNFDIIQGVFAKYGVSLIKSHKNPSDNAQKLYVGLAGQEIVLTDAMRQTFNSVSTRVIDARRAVKKIHGDPADDLYDMCAYAYNTWLVEAVKPERMRIQEQVAKMMREGKDPGTIFRWSLQETKKMERKERVDQEGVPLTKKRIGDRQS
jgi:hypothetical protein